MAFVPRRRRMLLAALAAMSSETSVAASSQRERVVAVLAPTGTLRASINLGNPVLAQRDTAVSAPFGVSVDLALRLADRLGVSMTPVIFDSARRSVDAVVDGVADVGFFAIDPERGAAIAFTAAYVLIEGSYLVRADSPIVSNDEADRPGRRIVVGRASAYDLYLSRTLKYAELVRAPTSPAVVRLFLDSGADVAAGVRQQLAADAARGSNLRLLEGRFMVIEQAMGLSRTRGAAAETWLHAFVEDAKASGFVAASLARHGIDGAIVAPATS